jgi:hypothetical protein
MSGVKKFIFLFGTVSEKGFKNVEHRSDGLRRKFSPFQFFSHSKCGGSHWMYDEDGG